MKTIIAMILLAALMGCGKKSDLDIQVTPVTPVTPVTDTSNCWQGTIILIEDSYTIFESTASDGRKKRLSRSGKWGQIGDTFLYCE